jgi:hypothetical protein
MNIGLTQDTYTEEDFTVSFALLLRRDAVIDFWNVNKPDNWRLLFQWGFYHRPQSIAPPMITVYRPNNTIGYFFEWKTFGVSTPFPDGIWT